ncbi:MULTISPECIES: hypothetical protein [unclassified Microcoleus]|uniref:hypothetical protein n=1 Tax=unclassified Microcoleus TaxID=2642155 RepID=UPI002FD0378A
MKDDDEVSTQAQLSSEVSSLLARVQALESTLAQISVKIPTNGGQFSFRCSKELRDAINSEAVGLGIFPSELLRKIVSKYLKVYQPQSLTSDDDVIDF